MKSEWRTQCVRISTKAEKKKDFQIACFSSYLTEVLQVIEKEIKKTDTTTEEENEGGEVEEVVTDWLKRWAFLFFFCQTP